MLSLTIMCCNFIALAYLSGRRLDGRRKILDWEVPLAELEQFAQEWGEKHDLKLHFEFKRCGPSFLVLMPRRLPDARRRSDDSESSEEEFEEDVLSPSAKRPPKAEFFRPRVMNEPPV
ncbi:RCBTB2 [Symbiodinium natans]|uniref:RCBTB2 protein n=1 Tax=Symbiodinium natans TaxID=878477 RepID=A0A812T2S2_9DINO|nr:RCBTB2 [Symbiodinium natans]